MSEGRLMRWPVAKNQYKSGGPSGRPTWVAFVNDAHLEWLLSWVPSNRQVTAEHEMDTDDLKCYNYIKEQAEEFMTRPDAKHWTAEARSKREQAALYGKAQMEERL